MAKTKIKSKYSYTKKFEFKEPKLLIRVKIEKNKKHVSCLALIDTGAEISLIESELGDQIGFHGLKPINIYGYDGNAEKKYIEELEVNIGDIKLESVMFSDANFSNQKHKAIIGLNAINQMDMILTNKNRSILSFRYPSGNHITFNRKNKNSKVINTEDE